MLRYEEAAAAASTNGLGYSCVELASSLIENMLSKCCKTGVRCPTRQRREGTVRSNKSIDVDVLLSLVARLLAADHLQR